jgi:hypothetical protein
VGTTYRTTKAGGETYFGNVGDMTVGDALKLFREHVQALSDESGGRYGLTAGDLIGLFLEWVK